MGMKWFSVGKQSELCKENIHHTVTSPSLLTADTRHEGCCAFAKFGPYHLNVAAETDNRQHVSNLLLPVQTVAQVLSRQEWDPMWSSVDAAHLLQSSKCCAFKDALLQGLVVTNGYLSDSCIFNQTILLWQSPRELLLTRYFLSFRLFSINTWDGCVGKSRFYLLFYWQNVICL